MTNARIEKIYAALDVGSSKISAMIAGRSEGGWLIVLGTGQRASKGVKGGYINDMSAAELGIREAVEQAEQVAGINIEEVLVSCTSSGMYSAIRSVDLEQNGEQVDEQDVRHLLVSASKTIDTGGKLLLHAQPTLYTIDNAQGVRDPIGYYAQTLRVDIHNIYAEKAPVRNLSLTIGNAHLRLSYVVAAPLAAGISCLSQEERDLGVALIEIGSEVTNVSVYAGGMLVGLFTIMSGGDDITDAIARAFALSRSEAERVKCFHGAATSSPRDNHDMIDLQLPDSDSSLLGSRSSNEQDRNRISRAQLVSVIRDPLDQMLVKIGKGLQEMGFDRASKHSIVLTGGCAELRGLADHMQVTFARTVRIGKPSGIVGLPEAHSGSGFSTVAGLLHFANNVPVDIRSLGDYSHKNNSNSGGLRRLWRTMRSNF